jgi:tungstate transport system substrate-binding protein
MVCRYLCKARVSAGACLLALAFAGCAGRDQPKELVLSTTTSVGNSGLLDALIPAFRVEHAVEVRPHLVGSGLALRMLEKGDADIVISHSPIAEAAALRSHPDWRYTKIMYNDFVLVGPPNDPAQVKGAVTAAAAMRRIAHSGAKFLSRGDKSGTHEREEALWSTAAARPISDRLIVAGAGMGATLRIASETGAYTLTDRASFAQMADALTLAIVCQGDPGLLNTYAVIMVPSESAATDAQTFVDWLSDGAGRKIIQEYRVHNAQAFFPWPANERRDDPHALPRITPPVGDREGPSSSTALAVVVNHQDRELSAPNFAFRRP